MKLQLKSLIRFFVSSEWETYTLGFSAILLLLAAIAESSSQIEATEFLSFIPIKVFASIGLVLLSLHLLSLLTYKNSYSKRFLALNGLQFFLTGIALIYAGSLLFDSKYSRTVEFGQNIHWVEKTHKHELAIIDLSKTDTKRVWTAPFDELKKDTPLASDEWRFSITPLVLYKYSILADDEARKIISNKKTIIGIAASIGNAQRQKLRMLPGSRTNDSEHYRGGLFAINYKEPHYKETLLLSTDPRINEQPDIVQTIDKTFDISLRNKRFYPPFQITISQNTTKPSIKLHSNSGKEAVHPLILHRKVRHDGYSIQVTPSIEPNTHTIILTRELDPTLRHSFFIITIILGIIHSCLELQRTRAKGKSR